MPKLLGSTLGANIKKNTASVWTDSGRDNCQLQTLGSPLSRSTYSLIESGKGNLLVNNLVGLQIVFAVTYEEFFKDISPLQEDSTMPTLKGKD